MTAQIRVLYSFPHKLGAERICYTAWQQVMDWRRQEPMSLHVGCAASPRTRGLRVWRRWLRKAAHFVQAHGYHARPCAP